ncbi:hypothetical protein [Oceaniglobus trochenteri]|uniref:hypothetical protein n=1 Tax=Oceaniglobus trochenteri TaxID=2763260 RepID=UPI001D000D0A|nr:hypothetical protein [Oceaniglobus trochenteri]
MPETPIAASSIAAQAFRFMEMGPISSFQDDSEQAQDALQQYPVALRSCLEACDWSFASTYRQLSEAALEAPQIVDPALPFAFLVPADCVRLREVQPVTVRWRIDGLTLRADVAGPLTVRYTARIENEAQLPATFQTAVSYRLATLLAPRWMATRTKIADLATAGQQTLQDAERIDARSASSARYDGRDARWSDDWVAGATW